MTVQARGRDFSSVTVKNFFTGHGNDDNDDDTASSYMYYLYDDTAIFCWHKRLIGRDDDTSRLTEEAELSKWKCMAGLTSGQWDCATWQYFHVPFQNFSPVISRVQIDILYMCV